VLVARLFSKALAKDTRDRLHVGCGKVVLPDWINVDLERGPGVDYVSDIRSGLPLRELAYVYAEHFLEHLTESEGAKFLRDSRHALRKGGVLRVSTPNLDWVMVTHYSGNERDPVRKRRQCRAINRAFYGWDHRFLYNDAMLEQSLRTAGFGEVTFHAYGESGDPELRDLEKHEKYPDFGSLQHVLIAEARGFAPVA
jgi:predicted SAM-dependent methyltransferase